MPCEFNGSYWNDPEQRNYILYECKNPENKGGKEGLINTPDDYHNATTYSCWHENEGMTYRCWGDSKKIANCPLINKSE